MSHTLRCPKVLRNLCQELSKRLLNLTNIKTMSKLLRKESPMLKGEVSPQQLQRRTKILRSQKVFPISIQTILAFKLKTRAQQLQKLLSRKRSLIGWTYSRSSTPMLLYLTLFGISFARSVIQSLNSSSIKNFCLIESLQIMFRSL